MDKNALLRSMKLFLFDMDGTLYLGDRLYSFMDRSNAFCSISLPPW